MNDSTRSYTAPVSVDVESKMGIEIRDIGIPPCPTILAGISREMARSDPDFNHLAGLIGSDAALAASLVKVANSPYYGFGKKVRSVHEALMVLGLKVTACSVAGLALQNVFKQVPHLELFWDLSARTARVSGWLVQQLPRKHGVRAEDAYTFGLFRDCGTPVLMIPFPEYFDVLQKANAEESRPFTAVEEDAMSINHATVGAELAREWLLPEDMRQAILHHHDADALRMPPLPSGLTTAAQRLIAIAHLAEYLIEQHSDAYRTKEWIKLGPAALSVLDLDEDALHALSDEAGEVVRDHE